jgi:hypothetical protein
MAQATKPEPDRHSENDRRRRQRLTLLTETRLFVGVSDDRGLVVIRFIVAVFPVFLVIIVVGIPRRHHIDRVDWPCGRVLGDVCDHIGLLLDVG